MYKNVGRKIKNTAKFFAWLEIIISVVVGIFLIGVGILTILPYFEIHIFQRNIFFEQLTFNNGISLIVWGTLVFVLGIIIALIINMFLFGYGEQIDKTTDIEDKVSRLEVLTFNSLNEQARTNANLQKIISNLEQKKENNTQE